VARRVAIVALLAALDGAISTGGFIGLAITVIIDRISGLLDTRLALLAGVDDRAALAGVDALIEACPDATGGLGRLVILIRR
jgi:hypothetical protein